MATLSRTRSDSVNRGGEFVNRSGEFLEAMRSPSLMRSPSTHSSLAPGRMQADCFEEALAAVNVHVDVNTDAGVMSHAEEVVLGRVEEEQGVQMMRPVSAVYELPLSSLSPHDPSPQDPQTLPADAEVSNGVSSGVELVMASSDPPPPIPFRRQHTTMHPSATSIGELVAATGMAQPSLGSQASGRDARACARRCGVELERVVAVWLRELSMLLLLAPSALAACGHHEAARWRLWLMRPLYALVVARLLCVVLFALARAPLLLDHAPIRYTVLVNAMVGWRACAIAHLALMGILTAAKHPDQAAWIELAGPDWDFQFGVHLWIASLAITRALLDLYTTGMFSRLQRGHFDERVRSALGSLKVFRLLFAAARASGRRARSRVRTFTAEPGGPGRTDPDHDAPQARAPRFGVGLGKGAKTRLLDVLHHGASDLEGATIHRADTEVAGDAGAGAVPLHVPKAAHARIDAQLFAGSVANL
ncbi:hypothetical protein T492DRAFT_224555 [Pavlovales sp. CCMP2436]|nr:hypothetical protein T492DRAFT_224555 [Pavlovales sp. CCMP2436]